MVPDMVKSSRSKNTLYKYQSYFVKFTSWCKFHGFSFLPASDSTLCVFLCDMAQKGVGRSVIDSYFYSIKWNHDLAVIRPNPCDNTVVKLTFEGCRRTSSKPVIKKLPITSAILEKIVDFYQENDNLKSVRVCTLCILGFSGFFRFSELASIQMNDLCFHDNFVSVRIKHSKTDQHNQGATTDIARTNNKLCPVSWLSKLIAMSGLTFSSKEYVFTRIKFCKNTNKYLVADSNKPLSYTRAREILQEALENVGEDKRLFGLHSLRSGGASAFANSDGICDPMLLNKHGRWKSSTSSEGYVHLNLDKRLSVSKNLGI